MKQITINITPIDYIYFAICLIIPAPWASGPPIFPDQPAYKYLTFYPADYGKEAGKWPLILFRQGAGEEGEEFMIQESESRRDIKN